jgi:hypothetical protein
MKELYLKKNSAKISPKANRDSIPISTLSETRVDYILCSNNSISTRLAR